MKYCLLKRVRGKKNLWISKSLPSSFANICPIIFSFIFYKPESISATTVVFV